MDRANQIPLKKGDIVTLHVTFVKDYACWGTANGRTGFMHFTGWAKERPIPDSACPMVGRDLQVQIIHVVRPGEELGDDITWGGEFDIEFAAAVPEAIKRTTRSARAVSLLRKLFKGRRPPRAVLVKRSS